MGMEQIFRRGNYDLSNNINLKKEYNIFDSKEEKRRKEKP